MKEIRSRLGFLEHVGLGYLTLSRNAGTLSGGEAQRIRLATQIGSNLTGVLYVLDEPSIGLHQRDNARLIETLKKLRDLGNTLIVVEHDEETIRTADHVLDIGPGAGIHGGYVVAEGTPEEIEKNQASLTGQYLSGKKTIEVPASRRKSSTFIRLHGLPGEQSEEYRRGDSPRRPDGRNRGLGIGQVHSDLRYPLPGSDEEDLQLQRQLQGSTTSSFRLGDRQGDSHRPEPHRQDAPLQSGHLHQGLRSHPASLCRDKGGQGARLQGGPLLLQCAEAAAARPARGTG